MNLYNIIKESEKLLKALPKESYHVLTTAKDQARTCLGLIEQDFKVKKKTVFVLHGFCQQKGFAYSFLKKANKKYGSKTKAFVPLHYNSLLQSIEESAKQLNYLVNSFIELGNLEQIYFIGHSLGGLITRHIVEDLSAYKFVKGASLHATPNNGTEVARKFSLIIGPSGKQMIPGSSYLQKRNAKYKQIKENADFRTYLNIYALNDPLIIPYQNAILEGAENKEYCNFLHMGTLLDDKILKQVVEYFAL